MAFGIFMHRADSIYNDIPSVQYQFPKQYLGRAEEFVGDWIIYLQPTKVRNTKGYFAAAKVKKIVPDHQLKDMYLALIEPGSYLDFGDPVPFRIGDQITEAGLLNAQGRISGRAQAAVRPVSPTDFARIIELGIGKTEGDLPRTDKPNEISEEPAPYVHLTARDRIEQLTSRPVRDRNFRKTVLRAYGERCAITGLRLINGRGRAEVEAAHIRPVEHDGPDIISNGIALSGTAHWMFDRGLVGLSNDLEILISRQANDAEAIRSMINPSRALLTPDRHSECPHPEFVTWHREKCFKH
ncbi:HNH endonuclease [Hoeflea sp. TYP-13]|uniref:HNH endonuclease n=1 Tax=Hoeflea sp. TYP-13 TaxID=3230023 RepID=UPI0034C6C638